MNIDTNDEEIKQELSETGKETGIELDSEDDVILEPFDPKKISIESRVVIVDTIIRRLKQGSILLSPSFQRNEVWNTAKKSRLIESIMLSIPLPMFYVAEDELGRWEVVDGLQRLSAIRDFLHGNKNGELLKLDNLEFLGSRFNGKSYRAIENNPEDQQILNTLLETELRFTVIKPGTPEAVKRNIFKRINTGGMPLTAQEIRHALYEGQSTALLRDLVNSEAFKRAIARKIDNSRMASTELVLRMVSFMMLERTDYKSSMDTWLSNAMRVLNHFPQPTAKQLSKIFEENELAQLKINTQEQIKQKFSLAMNRAAELFDGHAFRKSLPHEARKSPVNKSLFEIWGNVLAELSETQFTKLNDNKAALFEEYAKYMADIDFVNLISRHSSSQNGVLQGYQKIHQLVMNVIGK